MHIKKRLCKLLVLKNKYQLSNLRKKISLTKIIVLRLSMKKNSNNILVPWKTF